MSTAYLGPEGSYSHLAAKKMRPDDALLNYPSFPQVFNALVTGKCDGIVVPIENSLNGSVMQNMDLLQSTQNVCAVEQCTVRIDHRLATLSGADLNGVKNIYSHSQALEQCARYVSESFPAARLIPAQSTAAGLEKLKTHADACIVGAHIEREGITLSPRNIADDSNNFTQFLLIRRGSIDQDTKSRRIYFSFTCKNKSGALLGVLQRISDHSLNMTRINSRPDKNCHEEYIFFVECEGDCSDGKVKAALGDIKNNSIGFRLLGAY